MNKICTLEEFLNFLKISCGFAFDIDKHTFGERIKLQKYVFMAIRMGLDPKIPLDYGMYIRGPYSSSLADVYFNMDAWQRPIFDRENFNVSKFITTVGLRDTRWLEVACSIIYIYQNSLLRYGQEIDGFEIYEKLSTLKDFKKDEVMGTHQYLCDAGLIGIAPPKEN